MTNTIVKTGMKIADIFNVTTNIKGMVIGNIIKAIPKLIPDFDPTCTMNLTEYDISPISNKFELKFTATNPNNEVIWLIKTSGRLHDRSFTISFSKDAAIWHNITYSVDIVEGLLEKRTKAVKK
jgi:hypothetical protein